MTTKNPLTLARPVISGHAYGTQAWCDWRNDQMSRNDCEWVLDGRGGCYLRDRNGWTEAHTRQMAEDRERQRERWIDRHRRPERYT